MRKLWRLERRYWTISINPVKPCQSLILCGTTKLYHTCCACEWRGGISEATMEAVFCWFHPNRWNRMPRPVLWILIVLVPIRIRIWLGNSGFFYSQHCHLTLFCFSHQCHMCHTFQYFGQPIEIFWKKYGIGYLYIWLKLIQIRIRLWVRQSDADPTWSGFWSGSTTLTLVREGNNRGGEETEMSSFKSQSIRVTNDISVYAEPGF